MKHGRDIADLARCSGIDNVRAEDRLTMRLWLKRIRPFDRIVAVYGRGDRAAETVIDRVWDIFGRRPTSAEYRALAVMFREAADKCEADAGRKL